MTTVTAEQITDALNQAFVAVVPNRVTRIWDKMNVLERYQRCEKDGLTRAETAERLGVAVNSVDYMVRRYGLKFKRKRRSDAGTVRPSFATGRPPALKTAIAKVFEDGRERTVRDVCAAMGDVTESRLSNARRAMRDMEKKGLLMNEKISGVVVWKWVEAPQ